MPTAEQVKEIEDTIQKAMDAERDAQKADNENDFVRMDRKLTEAKNLYQEAIFMADMYYRIPHPPGINGPTYDPSMPDHQQGGTRPNGNVRIGRTAFVYGEPPRPSAPWLILTKIHEMYGHGAQIRDGGRWNATPRAEKEVEAYNLELAWIKRLVKRQELERGVAEKMVAEIKERKKDEYNIMPAEAKRRWKAKEPWLAFADFHGEMEYVLMGRDDLYEVIGLFKVPKGVEIVGKDSGRVVHQEETLGSLAVKYMDGDVGQLLRVNNHLAVRLSDLLQVVSGPQVEMDTDSARRGKRRGEQRGKPLAVDLIKPPRITPGGVLVDTEGDGVEQKSGGQAKKRV